MTRRVFHRGPNISGMFCCCFVFVAATLLRLPHQVWLRLKCIIVTFLVCCSAVALYHLAVAESRRPHWGDPPPHSTEPAGSTPPRPKVVTTFRPGATQIQTRPPAAAASAHTPDIVLTRRDSLLDCLSNALYVCPHVCLSVSELIVTTSHATKWIAMNLITNLVLVGFDLIWFG